MPPRKSISFTSADSFKEFTKTLSTQKVQENNFLKGTDIIADVVQKRHITKSSSFQPRVLHLTEDYVYYHTQVPANFQKNDYKLLSCPKAGIKLDKIIKYEENFSTNIVDPSIEIFFNTSDVIKLGKEVKFEKTVDSWKFKQKFDKTKDFKSQVEALIKLKERIDEIKNPPIQIFQQPSMEPQPDVQQIKEVKKEMDLNDNFWDLINQSYCKINQYAQICTLSNQFIYNAKQLCCQIVEDYRNPEESRRFQPIFSNVKENVVVSKTYYFSKDQIRIEMAWVAQKYNSETQDFIYDSSAIKLLANEFRNYNQLFNIFCKLKENQENQFQYQIPLTCLVDIQGFRCLVKQLKNSNEKNEYQDFCDELDPKLVSDIFKQLNLQVDPNLFVKKDQIIQLTKDFMPLDCSYKNLNHIRKLRQELVVESAVQLSSNRNISYDQEQQLFNLSKSIENQRIKDVVKKIIEKDAVEFQEKPLSDMLHQHGINVRYLGKFYEQSDLPYLKQLFKMQMISRSCKKILRYYLTQQIQDQRNKNVGQSAIVIDFLNLIFTHNQESENFLEQILSKQIKFDFDIEFHNFDNVKWGGIFQSLCEDAGISLKQNIKQSPLQKPEQQLINKIMYQKLEVDGLKVVDFLGIETQVAAFDFKEFLFYLKDQGFIQDDKLQQQLSNNIQAYDSQEEEQDEEQQDEIKQLIQSNFQQLILNSLRFKQNYEIKALESCINLATQSLKLFNDRSMFQVSPLIHIMKCYCYKGQIVQTLEIFEIASQIIEYNYGSEHPLIASLYEILCGYYLEYQQLDDFIFLKKTQLNLVQKIYDDKILIYKQKICIELGALFKDLQLYEEAKGYYVEAVLCAQQSKNINYLYQIIIEINLIIGNFEDALQYEHKLVDFYKNSNPSQNDKILQEKLNILSILSKLNLNEQSSMLINELWNSKNLYGVNSHFLQSILIRSFALILKNLSINQKKCILALFEAFALNPLQKLETQILMEVITNKFEPSKDFTQLFLNHLSKILTITGSHFEIYAQTFWVNYLQQLTPQNDVLVIKENLIFLSSIQQFVGQQLLTLLQV